MRYIHKNILMSSATLLALTSGVLADDRAGVYQLGELVVTGGNGGSEPGIGQSVVKREDIWTFQKQTLDQAVNLIPGVSSTLDSNGRRNEGDIFVRGFGRWQVPLMIDGVRVYLPADNRLDLSRFVTSDLAEIQVQKGYASVIDGPGAMGGLINLVTRKPTKPFEAEFQSGASFGGRGQFQGWDTYAMAGTRQDGYYIQGSGSYLDRDFWTMSEKYQPSLGSLEDGGRRGGSDNRDWRINAKVGITPNETDEYSLNFIKQSGEKGAPLNVYNDPPVPANSYWRWPWWDIQNLSFLSHTQLGEASYVKTKLFYNTFNNALDAFDNINYTTQSANGRFRSIYEDHAYGGSTEFGTSLIPRNTLKAALHYRRDVHNEWNINRPTSPAFSSTEPKQEQVQTTWSMAAENTFHLTRDIDLVGGLSFDKYSIDKAEEFSSATGAIYEYPKGGATAFNWQSAAIWRYSDTGRLNFSVSDRARFPTIFELYSTRFGTATPNPNLGAERATNYELGWKGAVNRDVRMSAAVFYSNVRDMIQTVQLSPGITQTQNVGNGNFYGVEGSIEADISAQLRVGGNYTWIHRTLVDPLQPNIQATGVPTQKAFLYLTWKPVDRLSVTPSVEIASARWSDVNSSPTPAFPYVLTGAYTLVNLQAEYELMKNVTIAAGARNLLDQNYELAWGLPQPGRNYFVRARATF